MYVADKIVILIRSCANLDTSNKTVTKLASVDFTFDRSQKVLKILFGWYVETGVPLAVDVMKRNEGTTCCAHGKLESEV
jgi:hypothetical protein